MNTFFEDDFFNKRVLNKCKKEVQKEQLDKTIEEINYFNELQENFLKRFGLEDLEDEVTFGNTKNAARKSL